MRIINNLYDIVYDATEKALLDDLLEMIDDGDVLQRRLLETALVNCRTMDPGQSVPENN